MTTIVIASEVCGSCFTAKITIDALIIDIKLAYDVFRIFVGEIGHKRTLKDKTVF
jgi:hypothetical protein